MKAEFSRVVEAKSVAKKMLEAFTAIQPKVLVHAAVKRLLPDIEDLVDENPTQKPGKVIMKMLGNSYAIITEI